ncbi:TolA protein [Minicystis rosea]|nr:TolA protein [Minicystis rosea]
MPLTAIHPFQKQTDLEANVRAVAILTGVGLVGVLTSGPARLALVPFAGGPATIVDLPIEAPQEIALLSKDVAVVRASDGDLWALRGLGGTLEAQPIARDVRALFMRPSGESALLLAQDGSAGAITLSREEVAVRSFTVRGGALRAADVGENLTYVVADGEEGGQFRIHPGATPELGTSARTALPAQAKDLDLVRGGPALSALWKRGSQEICLVTGSSKLAARMVEIAGSPADVAVLDDALIVAFADGTVSLYDAAALAEGTVPLTPSRTVAVSANGHAQLMVAVATKGAASLWLATTAGEVLQASLGREPASIEDAPPQPQSSAESDPGHATEAASDAITGEGVEQQAARVQANAEAAAIHDEALAALHREHAAVMEAKETAHTRAIEALRAEHASEIEALKTAHASALAEKDATLQKERGAHVGVLEELWSAHSAEVTERAAALEQASATTAARDEALAALRREQDALVLAKDAAHASSLEALKAEHAGVLEALKAEHATLLAEKDTVLSQERLAHVHVLEDLWSAHSAEVTEHVTAHQEALASLEAADAQRNEALAALRAEHEAALKAKDDEHARAIEALKAEHARAIDALKAEHAGTIEAREAALIEERGHHARVLEELWSSHSETLGQHEAAQERALAVAAEEADARREQAIAALKAEHASAIDALKAEHAATLAEREAALAQERAQHARVLEELWSSHSETLGEHEATRERALAAAAQQAEAAIAALKAEHASTIEAREAALIEERGHHARVLEELWSSHSEMLGQHETQREEAIAALKTEHASALDALKAEHAATLAEREAALGQERAQHARVLEELWSSHSETLGQHEERAAEERKALEVELDRLRAELSDERTKRDFVKWGDRTIPLDRVRGTLDVVIARAQEALVKKRRG